ncbi:MAG: energy-coupling factor transporter ATPase [Anaerovoracaceae bacterium]
MTAIISVKNLIYDYPVDRIEETVDEKGKRQEVHTRGTLRAVNGVSFDIEEGSFTAVIGRNGSGKSTLAKNLNGLLVPTEGTVTVGGWDTADEDHMLDVRQTAGMVFQNPDNQLVSSVVEADVAFGPENLGLDPEVIRQRVDEALKAVGMEAYRKRAPHLLSGGQKQRVAIAGIIAMRPKCMIFDEPTAMLDPQGRADVMKIIDDLHAKGITIVLITHFMEEAANADRVIIMDNGTIKADAEPAGIFSNPDLIREAGLSVPAAVEVADRLREKGVKIDRTVVTDGDLADAVIDL